MKNECAGCVLHVITSSVYFVIGRSFYPIIARNEAICVFIGFLKDMYR